MLVPYWITAHNRGETTPWWNVFVHAVGTAGVLILLTLPARQLLQWASDGGQVSSQSPGTTGSRPARSKAGRAHLDVSEVLGSCKRRHSTLILDSSTAVG